MDIRANLFVAPDDLVEVHEGYGAGPVIRIGDVSIHFRSQEKFLELWDHMDAYLSEPVEPSHD